MKTSHVSIETTEGGSYIRKLCKHFAHKIVVAYDEKEGTAEFPFGRALMTADEKTLRFDISSDTFEGISRIKYVLVTHLEKFAFRENLEIVWKDEPAPPEPDWELVAGQLRHPSGEWGIKTGINMNHANMGMIVRAFALSDLSGKEQLLELGPGNGAHLADIMKQLPGLRYTGVEISETMIQEASERCRGMNNIAFLMTDGKTLPFGDQAFDRVVTVNTVYFWEEPAAYAAEIRRVLKAGSGIFCLGFVSSDSMEKLPFTRHGFELYDLEKAERLLTDAGFVIRSVVSETETIRSNTGENIERVRNYILAG